MQEDKDDPSQVERDGKPTGSRSRVFLIYTYAVIFCVIFLGWPAVLSIWLTSGADPEMKAFCWSGAITWLIFHQSLLRQFCYPFGKLSVLRWMIMWPLHRDFGRITFWAAFFAARADVIREVERTTPKS